MNTVLWIVEIGCWVIAAWLVQRLNRNWESAIAAYSDMLADETDWRVRLQDDNKRLKEGHDKAAEAYYALYAEYNEKSASLKSAKEKLARNQPRDGKGRYKNG